MPDVGTDACAMPAAPAAAAAADGDDKQCSNYDDNSAGGGGGGDSINDYDQVHNATGLVRARFGLPLLHARLAAAAAGTAARHDIDVKAAGHFMRETAAMPLLQPQESSMAAAAAPAAPTAPAAADSNGGYATAAATAAAVAAAALDAADSLAAALADAEARCAELEAQLTRSNVRLEAQDAEAAAREEQIAALAAALGHVQQQQQQQFPCASSSPAAAIVSLRSNSGFLAQQQQQQQHLHRQPGSGTAAAPPPFLPCSVGSADVAAAAAVRECGGAAVLPVQSGSPSRCRQVQQQDSHLGGSGDAACKTEHASGAAGWRARLLSIKHSIKQQQQQQRAASPQCRPPVLGAGQPHLPPAGAVHVRARALSDEGEAHGAAASSSSAAAAAAVGQYAALSCCAHDDEDGESGAAHGTAGH
jgi:hypothetical protein